MPQPSFPWNGRCLCGQVHFTVSAPPVLTVACHCRGCQRLTSSAFSLSAAIPAESFEVIQGEPVIGALHGPSRHYFCPHCMSWLFTRPVGLDWFVNVRPTMFDGGRGCTPFVETMTDEKLAWATTPAAHSFPDFPPNEAYEGLMKAYAAQAG